MLKNISKLIIIFLCALLINTSYVGTVYAQDHTPNKKLIKKLKEEINELGAKPVKKKSIFSREQKWIDQLEAQLEERKVTIELDKEAKILLSEKGFDPIYGARPLSRAIQENIKKPLADKILFGDLVNGGHIKITVKKGVFVFNVSQTIKVKEKVL